MCNVGGVSFFFFCGREKKTKKNSIKFALSCQKAKSFLILILSISYLSGRLSLHLLPTYLSIHLRCINHTKYSMYCTPKVHNIKKIYFYKSSNADLFFGMLWVVALVEPKLLWLHWFYGLEGGAAWRAPYTRFTSTAKGSMANLGSCCAWGK